MAFVIIFVLGIGNFALHRAVLSSGHPALRQSLWFVKLGGRITLAVEFVLLLAGLLLVTYVSPLWAWGYVGYTLLNAFGAWLILSRRL